MIERGGSQSAPPSRASRDSAARLAADRRAVPAPRASVWRRIVLPVIRVSAGVTVLVVVVGGAWLGREEMRNATLHSHWAAEFAAEIGFSVQPGPATTPLVPDRGPWDVRLGYAGLPDFAPRLQKGGYTIARQAVPSRRMVELNERGVYAAFVEKTQTGLRLIDARGAPLQNARYPRHVYPDYEAVPDLVARALLYVEDRELLDPGRPTMNPVVDWERLGMAVIQQGLKTAGLPHKVIGASTLATQLEKFRHSPDGITRDSHDKLVQMVSATLRVYRDGAENLPARRRLMLDYLNSLPLAAQPGYGEVSSLGDGLEAWFGSDFAMVNRVLSSADAPIEQRALYFKQVLALVLSVRRPSYYLGQNAQALAALTDSHLRRMVLDRVIPGALGEAALRAPLALRARASASPLVDYTQQKGINLARTQLLGLLGVHSLYELDRLDLDASTTLDATVQNEVTAFLRSLARPERITELRLDGEHLMRAADPSKVIYSLTLYERGEGVNRLRINADNLDQPLDINSGAKLDLGSTAKLRTLLSWLELIAAAHTKFRDPSGAAEGLLTLHPRDHLSAWVLDYLGANPGASLRQTLDAAMQRQFSASPGQAFYTGGGVLTFANFDKDDNGRILSVAEATRRSVNLVFIRIMREVIDHYMYRDPASTARLLEDNPAAIREEYLKRFADREGGVFLRRFYQKYRGQPLEDALTTLLDGVQLTPRAVTVALRSVWPAMTSEEFRPWLALYVPDEPLDPASVAALFNRYPPQKFNLNDRGFLARVHPLELWLIEYLQAHPQATLEQTLAAGAGARQEVYSWLMKTSRHRAQDRRILDLLEIEAFQELHAQWQRVGYPFASLTPSLATSIGSSGDRPAALAELMGTLANGGVRYPSRLLEALDFGVGTPYEVAWAGSSAAGEQVLDPDVVAVARAALLDVVQNGTARALQPSLLRADGTRHVVAGKTGTGDHRFEVYSRPGVLIESRVVNRVATFVFMIDGRFFGTLTAYVPGQQAAQYEFTSGLPVRLLGYLMPTLAPLLDSPPAAGSAALVAAGPARDAVPAATEP